jgi:hypothetical protein
MVQEAIVKIPVSPEWTREERDRVISLMKIDYSGLQDQERMLRLTEVYNDPRFDPNKYRQDTLLEYMDFVETMSAEELEEIRSNFSDYVE